MESATPTPGGITITVRFIRSFEHRNSKNLVLHNVSPTLTTEELRDLAIEKLQTAPGFVPPFKKYPFDTFKIETQAFGAKTNDPVIRLDEDDQRILKEGASLSDSGIKNETEISFFKLEDYLTYKKNPCLKW